MNKPTNQPNPNQPSLVALIPNGEAIQTKCLYVVQWNKCKCITQTQCWVGRSKITKVIPGTANTVSELIFSHDTMIDGKNLPMACVYAYNETEAHLAAVLAMLPYLEQQKTYLKKVFVRGDGDIDYMIDWTLSVLAYAKILRENKPLVRKIELEQGFVL